MLEKQGLSHIEEDLKAQKIKSVKDLHHLEEEDFDRLSKAMQLGKGTAKKFEQVVRKLQQKLAEAVQEGYLPANHSIDRALASEVSNFFRGARKPS